MILNIAAYHFADIHDVPDTAERIYSICDAHALLGRMLVMLRLTAPEGEPATAAARQLVASRCGEPGWPQLLAAHDAARQEVGDWWAAIRSAAPQKEKEE